MDVPAIFSELDDHGFADTPAARKLAMVQDVVDDINSREPWPFLEKTTTVPFVVSNDTPVLPSDFGQVLELMIPSEGVVLQPERRDTVVRTHVSELTTTGTPFVYYFVGTTLKVLWVPDKAYTATLNYQRIQPALNATSAEASILLPPRHHRVIVLGALARLYAMEDDPEQAALFDQAYENRIKRMTFDLFKRQYDRPDRMIDFWADDWDWG